jgi:hypothetical protein
VDESLVMSAEADELLLVIAEPEESLPMIGSEGA